MKVDQFEADQRDGFVSNWKDYMKDFTEQEKKEVYKRYGIND